MRFEAAACAARDIAAALRAAGFDPAVEAASVAAAAGGRGDGRETQEDDANGRGETE